MKQLMLAAGLLLAATSGSWAQAYIYGAPYGYGAYAYTPGHGLYDYSPGVDDYTPGYFYGGNPHDYDRVDQPGRSNGAESQR